LLKKMHRHMYQPIHVHFVFDKDGYDHLITYEFPLFFCVFHSTQLSRSLCIRMGKVNTLQAAKYGIAEGSWLMTYDFACHWCRDGDMRRK
jgi:hypothetical protein